MYTIYNGTHAKCRRLYNKIDRVCVCECGTKSHALISPDDHRDVVLPQHVARSRLHQLRQHRRLEQLGRLQRHLAASHVIARGNVQLRLLFEELSQERVSHAGGGELGRDLVQVNHLGVVAGTTTAMTYCKVEGGKLFICPTGNGIVSNILCRIQIHLLPDGQIQIWTLKCWWNKHYVGKFW